MRVKAVLFDMDGLMFDTEVLYGKAWQSAAIAQGYSISDEAIIKIKGAHKELAQSIIIKDAGSGFDIDRARAYRNEYIDKYLSKNGLPVKKGLINLLEFLKANNIKISLATSTKRSTAEEFLQMTDVARYFDAATCGDEIENGKPAPDIFIMAAKKVGADIKECLVLEDSINGIRGGLDSGAYVIMIPDTIAPDEEISSEADAVLSDLDEVIEWIRGE